MGASRDWSGRGMKTAPPPNSGTADELLKARRTVAERGLTGAATHENLPMLLYLSLILHIPSRRSSPASSRQLHVA